MTEVPKCDKSAILIGAFVQILAGKFQKIQWKAKMDFIQKFLGRKKQNNRY